YAIFAPKNTPKDVVAKLNRSLAKAVRQPDVQEKFATLGATPIGGTPDELAVFMKKQIALWAAAVKSSGATAQ
ncbi:MAG: tripartite tricarboxylate transporter substrate-binding protein, partial [Noviherbaspirillum sp.]